MRKEVFIFCFGLMLQLAAEAQSPFSITEKEQEALEQKAKEEEAYKAPKDSTKSFPETMARVFGLKPISPSEKPRIILVRSLIVPGWGQYCNKDYWKMGLVYGAAAAGVIYGIRANNQRYQKYLGHYEKATFVSRGLVFYDDLNLTSANMVPVNSQFFVSNDKSKATFYVSDANGKRLVLDKRNGEVNGQQTDYFVAKEVQISDQEILGAFNTETFRSAKDQYRRWRDASYIGFAAGWLLFAVEAHVAAHLKTFDMSEDISFRLAPAGAETFGYNASGIKLIANFK